jgi:tetratricopeptide (TPR) repeat protein
MPLRNIRPVAFTCIIAAAIALGTALDAGQTGTQPVQYRSPEGVEYRSLPDTDAVKTARAALDADPKNITRIIDLGVAQSGARQFREAIATFTRGLEIEPNNALLLRWRGHRYLSVREFDRAFADLTRGGAIDSTIYGIWYHPASSSTCAETLPTRPPRSPRRSRSPRTPANWRGPRTGCGCRSAGPAAARTRRRCSIGGRIRSR